MARTDGARRVALAIDLQFAPCPSHGLLERVCRGFRAEDMMARGRTR